MTAHTHGEKEIKTSYIENSSTYPIGFQFDLIPESSNIEIKDRKGIDG